MGKGKDAKKNVKKEAAKIDTPDEPKLINPILKIFSNISSTGFKDLNFGNTHVLPLIFECGGNIINFQDPISPDRYNLYRLGTDLDSCN